MAWKSINVQLSTNVGAFRAQMAMASEAVRDFGGVVTKQSLAGGQGARQLGFAFAAMGAAALAGGAMAIKSAMDLESSLRNVATISDAVKNNMAGTTDAILDMSRRLPQTAKQLADGLYDISSSGFTGAAAMKLLDSSAVLASGGLTDTNVAALALTKVLNAYGLSVNDAGDVSDIMFQTVNAGVLTMDQLTTSMGFVVPMAAAAGISFAEVGAAVATVTRAGFEAEAGTTAVAGVIRGMLNPSKALTAQLQALGYESASVALEQLGLKGVIDILTRAVGSDASAWQQLFTDSRAANGAMALASDGGKVYATVFDMVADANARAGATQKALAEQSKGVGYQLNILRNQIVAAGTAFGTAMLPVIKAITGALSYVVAAFDSIPDGLQVGILLFGLFAGALAAAAAAAIFMAPGIVALTGLVASAGGVAAIAAAAFWALDAAMGPVAIAMAAVSAAVVIGTALWMKHAKAKADEKKATEDLTQTLDESTGAVTAETVAWLRNKAVKDGTKETLDKLSVSMDDYISAQLGDEEAQKRVTAAVEDYTSAIGNDTQTAWWKDILTAGAASESASHSMHKQKDAADQLLDSIGLGSDRLREANALWGINKTEMGANAAIADRTTESVKALTEAEKGLSEALDKVFDPLAAYNDAMDEGVKHIDAMAAAETRARTTRHDAELLALEDTIAAEKKGQQTLQEQRSAALKDRQDKENEANTVRFAAEKDALKTRQGIENDANDAMFAAEKEVLNRRHRAEDDALKARLGLLSDEYDARRKAAKREIAAGLDDIDFMIATTFGAEREMWKERRIAAEDAGDDRLNTIDHTQEAEATTLNNALDDRQKADDDALKADQDRRKTAAEIRQEDERKALDELQRIEKTGLDTIHDTQKKALQNTEDAERESIDRRAGVRRAALKTGQDDENIAATDRLAGLKATFEPTITAIQTHLQDQIDTRKQMYADLSTIIVAGEGLITDDILLELKKLPPAALAVLAAAGPEAIRAVLTTIADGLKELPIRDLGKAAGKNLGQGMGEGFLLGLGEFLGLPPGVDPMSGVMGSATWAAGGLLGSLWGAAPRAPGNLSPVIGQADGGILRFADGGEYHLAEIAAAGAMRLWAEPETGGEAYIPLAAAKRARSTTVLEAVADRFGYSLSRFANGGMIGAAGGSSGVAVSMPIDVRVSAAVGADPDHLSSLIAAKVEAGVTAALDQLGRRVTVKAGRR